MKFLILLSIFLISSNCSWFNIEIRRGIKFKETSYAHIMDSLEPLNDQNSNTFKKCSTTD